MSDVSLVSGCVCVCVGVWVGGCGWVVLVAQLRAGRPKFSVDNDDDLIASLLDMGGTKIGCSTTGSAHGMVTGPLHMSL